VTTTRTAGTRAAPTPVFDRDRLQPGQRVAGPCLVADPTASVWVDADARLEVHPTGALVIEVGS
jgi:N-methylhydantoinase A/oxoprolinase/acetone carboxylase beta subunit